MSTKGVTAACAHLLAQRDELDLDAPVVTYRPEFAAAGKDAIPVRWLLTHRAGLPALDTPATPAEVIAWEPVVAARRGRPGRRHPGRARPRRAARAGARRAGAVDRPGLADRAGDAEDGRSDHLIDDPTDQRAANLLAAVRASLG